MIYEVQTRMVNTWENCWTDGGVPMTFTNKREAQLEIDDLLALMPDYSPEDYRIVELEGADSIPTQWVDVLTRIDQLQGHINHLEDALRALLDDDNESTRAAARRALECS